MIPHVSLIERERALSRYRLSRTLPFVLALTAMGLPPAGAQQQVPPCQFTPPSTSDTGPFEHRWTGLAYTITTLDGDQVWIGEDGGRIRRRHPTTGVWSFMQVPYEVQGIIRKIHFLDDQTYGWATSSDGWVLGTDDAGASWYTLTRMSGSFGIDEWEDLYGIWMYDYNGLDGILLGRRGIWYTEDGGVCWEPASIGAHLGGGSTLLWGLAVQVGLEYDVCSPETPAPTDFLGLVVGQPGYILRSVDWGETWQLVFTANTDLDGNLPSGSCLEDGVGGGATDVFALWDVAISSNDQADPFAVVAGGLTNDCGMILVSEDTGCSWSVELHECDVDVDCDNDPAYQPGGTNQRLPDFRQLYGVDLYHDTHEAVAVGYNGQHLYRDPVAEVWRDRSIFGPIENAPDDVVVYPLTRVSVAQVTDEAWLSGFGGHVRHSDNRGDDDLAGNTWSHVLLGEPFRKYAVFLKPEPNDDDRGWIVGQGYRIAWTIDGGKTWTEMQPAPVWDPTCHLNDISFAGDLDTGVTVGCAAASSGPKILYTDTFATTQWQVPTSVNYSSSPHEAHYEDKGHLRRVAWAGDSGDQEFWAAGDDGLILRTTNGGAAWSLVYLPSGVPDELKFQIRSVAALGGTYAVFVGSYEGRAMAWVHNSSTPSWLQISPASADAITLLTDVAFHGNDLYAVGQKDLGGGEVGGVLLKYNAQAQPDPAFEEIVGPFDPDPVPDCDTGGSAPLTRLAFDPDGNLWIGGACGRVWELPDSSSTWVAHKSKTSTDITCIQPLSGDRIYFAGHVNSQVQQCLVRVDR